MYRILLAEDDPAISSTLAAYLGGEGFAVVTAATESDALHRLGTNPDLALLDIVLGEGSGYAVCRAVRSSF